nr:uncharacterized protein LOC113696703 [Coffea arabica]
MGFCEKWIKWIMKCISTVSFSFNINGECKEYIETERGIRLGDTLSSYLFLICSEGFSNLLRRATQAGRMNGIKISRQGPSVTHLFFADDSLIFCRANSQEAKELRRILELYEQESGQVVNLDKSSVFFSKNVTEATKEGVCAELGSIQPVSQGKYLGLPMVITRTKKQLFGYIKDNIKRRMQSWKNKLLSSAGKEILIKAISMTMPTYTMFCFKLPCRLCKEISSMLSNFWWGEKDNKNKVHWIAWKQMTKEKKRGGMGFQEIQSFNRALLAK